MRTRRDTRARRRGPGEGGGFKVKVDYSGWMRKSKRVRGVAEGLPNIRLSWEGTGWNGTSNENIALHAIANGDKIWTFTDGLFGEMAALLRDGLVAVARREQRDCDAEMDEIKDMAREDVAYNIADGKIDGPARTPEWNAFKAAKWGPQTPNMVASGEWLASLTAELVER